MLDPLVIIDRRREQTDAICDILAGRPAFLLGGGPSTKALDLSLLKQRGIFTMAVNNMAGHFHANAFVHSDPPSKFHDGIWLDPTVMKFVPAPKFSDRGRGGLRHKNDDGEFVELRGTDGKPIRTLHCPNTWGFARRVWWEYDDTFFNHPEATWGNANAGVKQTGNPKTMCTLLIGLRLLYYLGSRRIFLVGVDFDMSAEGGYAFPQERSEGAVRSNSSQYAVVNYGLCRMVENKAFENAGLEVFNCNPNSGLRAFPYAPYLGAIENALAGFPKQPFDLMGWYEKGEKKQ